MTQADQTIIEQVARLDERIAEHRAHIAKIEAQYGSGTAKLDERCAGIVLGFDQVLDLRALLTTLQSSAVLPSEAMIERGREAVQAMIDMPVGDRSPAFLINRKEALTLLESYRSDVNALAMRATTPTAPVQDDDAEWLLEQARRWDDDTVVHRIIRTRLERIASRLSPTPETGLVEALRDVHAAIKRARDMVPDEEEGLAARIFAYHLNAADAKVTAALSNVSRR